MCFCSAGALLPVENPLRISRQAVTRSHISEMPTRSQKRRRDAPLTVVPPPASFRSALASRVAGETPHFWRRAAASAGISGADAFLVHLGQSISTALQSIAEASAEARAQLCERRGMLHAAVDARCEELAAGIDLSEASKVASLERELISVDAALERWRAESGAVREAVSLLSDVDLQSQLASLSSRLDDMEAQLQALPIAVVEPPFVGLHIDAPALLSSIAGFGRVLAPLSIASTDMTLEGVPSFVRPGDTLRLRLSLGARHAAQSAEELEVSLGRLAGATNVEVMAERPGVDPQPLDATVAADAALRCLCISLKVPIRSSAVHVVCVGPIIVMGKVLLDPPLRIPLFRGTCSTPLILKVYADAVSYATPCISPEGLVYCPRGKGADVRIFDADGTPLPSLPVADLGLSEQVAWAAYSPGDAPSLLLADCNGTSSRLVAVDPVTHTRRWISATTSLDGCGGIAALPLLGVVVVNSKRSLFAHRLSDGVRVGSLGVPSIGKFRPQIQSLDVCMRQAN